MPFVINGADGYFMGPVRTDRLVAAVHPEDQGWLSGLL